MKSETSILDLTLSERRAVRLVRRHLFLLSRKNKINLKKQKLKAISESKIILEKIFNKANSSKIECLSEIALFDSSPPKISFILAYDAEFKNSSYPPVEDNEDTLIRTLCLLDSSRLLLTLDTMELMFGSVMNSVRNKIMDFRLLLKIEPIDLQKVFRKLDSSRLHPLFKVFDEAAKNTILHNVSQKKRKLIEAEIASLDKVIASQALISVLELNKVIFNLLDAEVISLKND